MAPAFICTANIDANDGGAAIVAGNEKVLAARLSDAKFFWEADLKIPLADQAAKLSQITFHEKLGTVADKVERVAKLARWLVEGGIVKSSPALLGRGPATRSVGGEGFQSADQLPLPPQPAAGGFPPQATLREAVADLAERAARLCKADLVTGSVGEFPELQGIMGGRLARAQGEDDAIADAIRDHYKPVGQGDVVPTAPVTVAVSLADKLDTIVQFFDQGIRPTGSKDPFALRRAALAIVQLLIVNNLRLGLRDCFHSQKLQSTLGVSLFGTREFFIDRLKVQQREAGVRHDVVDAAFGANEDEDDLVRLLARVHALQAFIGTEDGVNLLAGYKRAANLLKQAGGSSSTGGGGPAKLVEGHPRVGLPLDQQTHSPVPLHHPADGPPLRSGEDHALLTALNHAEPTAQAAIAAEDFTAAMAALASLRAPIDAFFDGVMVNDPDPATREFRLNLLARFRDAVHAVADFSKIEG